MNILFVSNLYPTEKKEDLGAKTLALHGFTKEWRQGANIQVIRPAVFPEKRFIKSKIKTFAIDGVNIIEIYGKRIPGLEIYSMDIERILNKIPWQPDIVVAHMYKSYFWANKIAEYYKIPFAIGLHYADIKLFKVPWLRLRLKKIYDQADKLFCRSFPIQNRLLKVFPSLTEKTIVVPSGIKKSSILPLSTKLCQINKIHDGQPIRFITVARLLRLKNIDINLKALSTIGQDMAWEYHIVGDGPARQQLELLCNRLELDKQVLFHGWKSQAEIFDLLQKSHIFIMVSAPETFGLSYLEAMANGCFVIGAKDWGIDGVVKNRKNGFLCIPRNQNDLVKTIRMVLNMSPTQLDALVRESHETILQYTEEKCAMHYLTELQSMLL